MTAEWGEVGKTDAAPANAGGGQQRVNCFKCAYFRITWDPKKPRACAYFEFSCADMPSVEVKKTTGKKCLAFVPKPSKE